MNTRLLQTAFVACVLLLSVSASAQRLWMVEVGNQFQGSSNLYEIDPSNSNIIQTVGATGRSLSYMAYDGTTGVIYATGSNFTDRFSMYTLDPNTGSASPQFTLSGSRPGAVGDMAFDANGQMYMRGSSDQRTYAVDKSTGVCSQLPNASSGQGGQALAIHNDGRAFSLQNPSTTTEIDLTTGSTIASFNAASGCGNQRANGADFDDNGLLYYTNGNSSGNRTLNSVDIVAQTCALVGTNGPASMHGLAFERIPQASGVPATSTVSIIAMIVLLSVGLLAVTRFRAA